MLVSAHRLREIGRWTGSRSAVKRLDRFTGRATMLTEVDDAFLDAFTHWMANPPRSISRQRVKRYVSLTRAIVRHWDPSRFHERAWNKQDELPSPAEGTVRRFQEAVYIPQRMIDASRTGIYQTRLAVRRLHTHYGRDIALSELSDALAADHFQWLRTECRLSAVSINTAHRATLFAIWRFAHELGLVDTLPRVRKLKELWNGPVPLDKFWRALLLVCFWTGLLRGALLSIRQEDVDLSTGWLYVRPAASKE